VHCSKFQNVEPFTVNGLWKPLEIVICFTGTKKTKNKQTNKQKKNLAITHRKGLLKTLETLVDVVFKQIFNGFSR